MAEQPCPRLGRFFRGCRFVARYDTSGPTSELRNALSLQWGMSERDKDRLVETETYVHDICTTCGRVVDRSQRG